MTTSQFDEWWMSSGVKIARYIVKPMHFSHEDKQDLVMGSYLRARAQVEFYDPERGLLRNWFWAIAITHVRHFVRARDCLKRKIDSSAMSLDSAMDEDQLFNETAACEEQGYGLVEAMIELDSHPKEKDLVLLRAQGYTYDEFKDVISRTLFYRRLRRLQMEWVR